MSSLRVVTRLIGWILVLCSTLTFALAPATQRTQRHVRSAFNNVKLIPELRNGPIPGDRMQTAKNLLSDLDSAISRAQGDLGMVPEPDKADPGVVELSRQLEEFIAFRADLKKAMEGAATASAANEALFKGRTPLKTGMLVAGASIDKNALGIPTERYRTGALLAKGSGKWCEYRQFTAHETYSGGGTFAPAHFTFGAMRLQKCP